MLSSWLPRKIVARIQGPVKFPPFTVIVRKSAIEEEHTPCSSISKSVYWSWLARGRYREKITLYDAYVSNKANALLQSAKQYGYSNEGKI